MMIVCEQENNRMTNRTLPLKGFKMTSVLLKKTMVKFFFFEEFRPETLIAEVIAVWGHNNCYY